MGGTAQVASTGADCRISGSGHFRSCASRLYIRIARSRQSNRSYAVCSLGTGALQVFLGVWRVRLLVMPEMRQAFHYIARSYGRWNNPFARHCAHCGLPKWVDSDPDPNLKSELDPLRSNSIFKLSE